MLRGVTLAVRAGEIACIIGANGAGKSTLLRTVFGLLTPRQGTIRFAGEEIGGRPSTQVLERGIGYVPQGRCNFPAMSVEENLEMGAYLRRDARVREDIEALLTRLPMLAGKRRDPAGTLGRPAADPRDGHRGSCIRDCSWSTSLRSASTPAWWKSCSTRSSPSTVLARPS